MFSIIKIYSWTGITSTGKPCQGKELLLNKDQLSLKLHRQDIFIKNNSFVKKNDILFELTSKRRKVGGEKAFKRGIELQNENDLTV